MFPTTDQPLAVQPGQLTPHDLIAEVLRTAALHCEQLIDMLPALIETGRISLAVAQQADRYLTTYAETLRVPLVARGETVPQPIR